MLNITTLWFLSIFLFVFGNMASAMVEGSTGLGATRLDGAIDDATGTITVDSTTDFLSAATSGLNILFIDGEQMIYGGISATQFTSVSRGENETKAKSHSDNATVYSAVPGRLNQLLAFQVAESDSSIGTFRTVVQLTGAIFTALPALISWDYSWMTGNYSFIRYMGYVLSATLILGFFLAVGASAVQGVFRR